MTLRTVWEESVKEKDSVLCSGLDPAEHAMGRKDEGLPEGINKVDWCERYTDSVAQFSAALKPNFNYFKNDSGPGTLTQIADIVVSKNILYIDDAKIADIGDTNDAGIFYSARRGFHAVTIAPYAGNMQQTVEAAKKRGISIITMCLMSNPEYEFEKNALMPVREEDEFHREDIVEVPGKGLYVPRYIQLAHHAQRFGVEGIVIGAPSTKNHLKESELEKVRSYVDEHMVVLLPGVGRQGGEAALIWKYFHRDKVIVNVGRDLMFPKGKTHAEQAEYYKNTLNDLRYAA